MCDLNMKQEILKNLPRGTIFEYTGQRWIVLEHNLSGTTLCLSETIIENQPFDEKDDNNWAKSSSYKYLNNSFLNRLIETVGVNNAFQETEIDLTTDDGLKDYGVCKATIFLLTADQYRRNRDVIPNADNWWWLSTAFSTISNGYKHFACRVRANGTLSRICASYSSRGLRPACMISSDLKLEV